MAKNVYKSIKNVIWELNEDHKSKNSYALHPLILSLLEKRNINIENDEYKKFLHPKIKDFLPNPFTFKDMSKAINRTTLAIKNNEKITIFGDYDVDGACSSAILKLFFKKLTVDSDIYIPDRMLEGYGPNPVAMEKIRNQGSSLCITVDCGISAFEALERAKEIGLDVIVLDHHLGQDNLPVAEAIVNPNRKDETSPHKDLAGAGVTFMFLVALNKNLRDINFFKNIEEPDLYNMLDLVALGTVCDVVNLCPVNRAFVSRGLEVMKSKKNIGLQALIEASKCRGYIDEAKLGYLIGPCINAGGRLDDASIGARLLSTSNYNEAYLSARRLVKLNDLRKEIEKETVAAALEIAKEKFSSKNFALLGDTGWHAGITGIVAGRIKDVFDLPAAAFSYQDGICKASVRSIQGVNVGSAIIDAVNTGLVIVGGGHSMAAGFAFEYSKLDAVENFLAEKLEDEIKEAKLNPIPRKIDNALLLEDINKETLEIIRTLAPFGRGNPEPVFLLCDTIPKNTKVFCDSHLSCALTKKGSKFSVQGVAFKAAQTKLHSALENEEPLDIVGKISMSYYKGKEQISFVIEDIAVQEVFDTYVS